MNRAKRDSIAHAVRDRVVDGGTDRLWTYADFPPTDRMALAAALSRLVKAGELTRVRRGVYFRPSSTRSGPSRPDPEALVDATLRARGETPVPSGLREYNRLGLTTRVSGAVTRATRRRVAYGAIPGVRVRVSERPLDAQQGIRAEERAALDALREITRIPDASPATVLRRIKVLLRAGRLDYGRLARYAGAEPPRVRALLGALGEALLLEDGNRPVDGDTLRQLRRSLNPLTAYHVPGADSVLPTASAWRIK